MARAAPASAREPKRRTTPVMVQWNETAGMAVRRMRIAKSGDT